MTKRYTEESVNWITRQSSQVTNHEPEDSAPRIENRKPFFLFLGHSMPHVPIFASPEFRGHSQAGLYGDVIEEIDWSVGEIIRTLRETGVAENTLVIFSSDNGPWLTYYDLAGSPGPLRDGKMAAWEGGFRVPGIFWWPGKIHPAVINDIGCNVDLMATLATLTGAKLPADRTCDSIDLSATLLENKPSPRTEWFYYGQPGNLWAYRIGNYKLVLESWESLGKEGELDWRGFGNHQKHDPPLLFDLGTDLHERLDIAADHPAVVETIRQAIQTHQKSLKSNRRLLNKGEIPSEQNADRVSDGQRGNTSP